MTATMSILGLYQYDPTVLDPLEIPSEIEREPLIGELLAQCAEFEILYPDPEIMKLTLGFWSSTMLPIWKKLYETTVLEYDPISNYDRTETWKEKRDGFGTVTESGNTVSQNQAQNSRTGINTGDGFQPTNQSLEEGSVSNSGSSRSTGEDTIEHESHIYGNIGVVSSQTMIESQRKVVQFSIVQKIIDDFKERFCICVY